MNMVAMPPAAAPDVLPPATTGWRAWLKERLVRHALPPILGGIRALPFVPHLGKTYVVARYDDAREVLLDNDGFRVDYSAKLDVITGHKRFMLGMDDGGEHQRDREALRSAVPSDDIRHRLVPAVAERAEALVAGAPGGRIEVVGALARQVTFDVLCDYLGVPDTAEGRLRLWATRLFSFQFAGNDESPEELEEIEAFARELREHVGGEIARRRAAGAGGAGGRKEDVLGRLLAPRGADPATSTDEWIRTALVGLIVGGFPQPPIAVPYALEQLLRRRDALKAAQEAARLDDDEALAGHVFEALRFDPLAPVLKRVAARERKVAAGTPRATTIPAGATVQVGLVSAMRDPRRLAEPRRFDPRRLPHEHLHFGEGIHACFAAQINRALLPQMLKPLLLPRRQVRRARAPEGHLAKRGVLFAERLWVEYDP